jgi:hypothetical protein
MSWDVVVIKANAPPPPIEKMPSSFVSDPMGTPDEVRAAISRVLPSVGWSAPTWGLFDGESFSFEFLIGDEPQVQSLSILVLRWRRPDPCSFPTRVRERLVYDGSANTGMVAPSG